MKTTSLEKVIYFQDYVVVDPGNRSEFKQLLTEEEYKSIVRHANSMGLGAFEADMGAEAVRKTPF